MTDYTPTTETVRERFADGFPRAGYIQALEDFDRWLAAHDAEVRAAALREAAEFIQPWNYDRPDDWTEIARSEAASADTLRTLAGVAAEEPEWEYGVALAGGNPDGYIYRWPTLEAAEALAELNPAYKPSYYRRVKAGPWEPLPEGADQ